MSDFQYQIVAQMVRQRDLHLFCSADPAYYKNTTQTTPNSQIPDEHWEPWHSGISTNPWDQLNALRDWEANDEQFVRNVRLLRASLPVDPGWEEVERP